MSISTSSSRDALAVAAQVFYPLHTVRCSGPGIFRSQLSRDIACILDVDDDVNSWSCMPFLLANENETYRPDFLVETVNGLVVIDSNVDAGRPAWVGLKAQEAGYQYDVIDRSALPATRLRNAKDLLRYARYEVSLSDRVRLLALLDENGSLSVADALGAFADAKPIGGLASLFLQRFITMDLDVSLIGPETIVSRKRD